MCRAGTYLFSSRKVWFGFDYMPPPFFFTKYLCSVLSVCLILPVVSAPCTISDPVFLSIYVAVGCREKNKIIPARA